MSIRYLVARLIRKFQFAAIKNSNIDSTSKVESQSSVIDVSMGKHSFIGCFCDVNYADIGNYCSIANNVIIGGGMHPLTWVGTSPVFYEGRDSIKAKFSEHSRTKPLRTNIGSDVWIGQNVIIKQGIKIGHGAVVGMGSVVTKDVDDYAIVGGNPAKLIRYRFDNDTRQELLKSEWWHLREDILQQCSKYIKNPSIFLDEVERNKR